MLRVETRGHKNEINNLTKEIKARSVLVCPLCRGEFSIPNDVNMAQNVDKLY